MSYESLSAEGEKSSGRNPLRNCSILFRVCFRRSTIRARVMLALRLEISAARGGGELSRIAKCIYGKVFETEWTVDKQSHSGGNTMDQNEYWTSSTRSATTAKLPHLQALLVKNSRSGDRFSLRWFFFSLIKFLILTRAANVPQIAPQADAGILFWQQAETRQTKVPLAQIL